MSGVRVEIDEVVARPIEQVFERATDLSQYAEWMPHNGVFKTCSDVSEGPVRPGTTYLDRGRMGSFHGVVSEFERPSRVTYKETLRWFGAPVVVARIEYAFSPDPRGTAVHHVAESELHGVFKLMRPMVAVIGRGERQRTVTALKRSLESETSSTTASTTARAAA
jgi:uncharacterized protein YndB with AHSA1/START domain